MYLEVTTTDGQVIGRWPSYKRDALLPLVDATVRIRGTCGSQFNSANQMTGVFINIPYESEIEILQPPPAEPFNIATHAISDLLRFNLTGNLGHRVKVQGVVTLYRPGKAIFIQVKTAPSSLKRSRILPRLPSATKLIWWGSPQWAATSQSYRTPSSIERA